MSTQNLPSFEDIRRDMYRLLGDVQDVCCQPTRLDILRWRVRSELRRVGDKLRRRPAPTGPDEPPF